MAKKGSVQAAVGADVSFPAGPIKQLIDQAERLEARAGSEPLTDDERRELSEGAWAVALNPPSFNTHIGAAVGVATNTEIQGKLAGGGWRVGARYQLLHDAKHGIDFSTGLGVGRVKTDSFIPNLLSLVEFEGLTRWQFDVPLVFGRSGSWYRWWGGPRALLVTYAAGIELDLPEIQSAGYAGYHMSGDFSGYGLYLGGQLGGAIGYKHVFLAAELSVAQFLGRATLTTTGDDALGTYSLHASGLILYPGFGLMAEF